MLLLLIIISLLGVSIIFFLFVITLTGLLLTLLLGGRFVGAALSLGLSIIRGGKLLLFIGGAHDAVTLVHEP